MSDIAERIGGERVGDYCDGCALRGRRRAPRSRQYWCFVFRTFFRVGDVTACNRRIVHRPDNVSAAHKPCRAS